MCEAPSNKPAGTARWRMRAVVGVAAVAVLLLIGWGSSQFVGRILEQSWVGPNQEKERKSDEADAKRKAEEAEQQRAAAKAEQERQARAAAEADAKRKAEEAEQQLAAAAAEQERQARTAAEADAKRKAEEAEQQRAAAKAEQERQARAAAEADAKRKAEEAEQQRAAAKAEQERQARTAAEAERKAEEMPRPKGLPPHQWVPSPKQFPIPPPAASAFYVLPDSWFADLHTLGEVIGAIIPALERNGYVERSFFGVEGNGVALVTRLERISSDGSSFADPQRWPGAGYSLSGFLKGLFFVEPGRYRIIVFILRNRPFSQSSQIVTKDEARAWLSGGADTLSPEAGQSSFGGWHCTVLIYEFASDGRAVRVVESSLTGKQHLTKAGLLSLLEKN